MTFSALPECLQDLVCDIAWGLPFSYIKWDVDQCATIQACVPPDFFLAVSYRRDQWGYVNSPYRKGNAYFPRTFLEMSPCWNDVPLAFVCMISREHVRALKTYKAIFLRRVSRLGNSDLTQWNSVCTALKRLRFSHFQRSANRSFLREVLKEIAESSCFPDTLFSHV